MIAYSLLQPGFFPEVVADATISGVNYRGPQSDGLLVRTNRNNSGTGPIVYNRLPDGFKYSGSTASNRRSVS